MESLPKWMKSVNSRLFRSEKFLENWSSVAIHEFKEPWFAGVVQEGDSRVCDTLNNYQFITRSSVETNGISVYSLKTNQLLQKVEQRERICGITHFRGKLFYWTPSAFYLLANSPEGKLRSEVIYEFKDRSLIKALFVVKQKGLGYELRIHDNLRNVFCLKTTGVKPTLIRNECSILLAATKNSLLYFRESKKSRPSEPFHITIGSSHDQAAVFYDLVRWKSGIEKIEECLLRSTTVDCCESVIEDNMSFTLFSNNVSMIVNLENFKITYGVFNDNTFIHRFSLDFREMKRLRNRSRNL